MKQQKINYVYIDLLTGIIVAIVAILLFVYYSKKIDKAKETQSPSTSKSGHFSKIQYDGKYK